jgi:hypothetical protein
MRLKRTSFLLPINAILTLTLLSNLAFSQLLLEHRNVHIGLAVRFFNITLFLQSFFYLGYQQTSSESTNLVVFASVGSDALSFSTGPLTVGECARCEAGNARTTIGQ